MEESKNITLAKKIADMLIDEFIPSHDWERDDIVDAIHEVLIDQTRQILNVESLD